MRSAIKMKVIIEKNISVKDSKDRASLFLPSTYICAGFPKIKNPVKAAEKTSSNSKAIGTRAVFVRPSFIIEPKYIKQPTAIT